MVLGPVNIRRVRFVDVLRAIAALSVLLCHVNAYIVTRPLPSKSGKLLEAGAHGVDLFIVISGFCLALPVFASGGTLNAKVFWGRRALRLLPPYYVGLAIAAVLATLPSTYHYVVAAPSNAWDILLHVTLLQTIVPGHTGTINGSLWSIALEAQLYLTFPLFMFCWSRFGAGRMLAITAGVAVMWSLAEHVGIGTIGNDLLLPARWIQFAGGVWCAELVVTDRRPERRWCAAVVLVGGILAMATSSADLSTGTTVAWTVPCVALVLLTLDRADRVGAIDLLRRLGVISYSFYLVHQPIVLLLATPVRSAASAGPTQLILGTVLSLAATLPVAYLLWRLVELPSQARARVFAQAVVERSDMSSQS